MSNNKKFDWVSWLIVGLALVIVALAVSGCQTYQPPGEDLWILVR